MKSFYILKRKNFDEKISSVDALKELSESTIFQRKRQSGDWSLYGPFYSIQEATKAIGPLRLIEGA